MLTVLRVSLIIGLLLLLGLPAHRPMTPSAEEMPYEAYAQILREHVSFNRSGKTVVDYQRLQTAGSETLDRFLHSIREVSLARYNEWDQATRIAFLLNAYNAFTLRAIADHYPIQPTSRRALLYPANSIRQIEGVWTRPDYFILGQRRSLDDIEHVMLRQQFDEPRLHMALVCAAMSCPPLRMEPYTGKQLDEQLDDQTRLFLEHRDNFHVNHEERVVYLSSIFHWYGKDFVASHGSGPASKLTQFGPEEQAVLNFIWSYLDPQQNHAVFDSETQIVVLHYDWTLNDRSP